MDFSSKALDKVSNGLLVLKLRCSGFSGKVIAWMENFLTHTDTVIGSNGGLFLACKDFFF